jgi:hypothetical protein
LNSAAIKAGKRLPATSAAKTRLALEIIIRTGRANISEITNPKRSSVKVQMVILTTLALAVALILRLSGHRTQKSGRAR